MNNKWMNILISIDDSYLEHAKDLIVSLAENNIENKFCIYLIYDDSFSSESIQELNRFITDNHYGALKTYYFHSSNDKFPMYIDYITQNTYYRLFAPYMIEDDIDRILYLDCDILCNGSIREFYNQDFENNILVACENIVPIRLKKKFKRITSYLNLQESQTYINAGVLLIDIKAYKDFISRESIYESIKENQKDFIFQDQDVINFLFQNNIKLADIIYNYQINVIDHGLNMKDCRLVHYSEANKPWNAVKPNFKRGLHYYKFLYQHNKKKELKALLKTLYNKDDYYEYVSSLKESFNEVDIIIPTYYSKEYLHKALESISSQTYKDIRVYIIDDASNDDYMEVFHSYKKLDIFYQKLEKNSGPGVARQRGIDSSFGNYIIFLDSDDVFYDNKAVETLYNAALKADVVTSRVLEETKNIIYANETIGLHGKIYRRAFLEENNIKFPNTRLNEDTYFNALCTLSGARYNPIQELTYLWCDNPNSITRRNKEEHIDKDIISYCEANLDFIKTYLRNHKNKNMNTVKPFLVKIIVLVADKYRTCSFRIKGKVLDSLNRLIMIYLEMNSIENIKSYITDDKLNMIYEKNKNLILKIAESNINVSNYNNEDKISKMYRGHLVDEYNKTTIYEQSKRKELLNEMFHKVEGNCIIEPPFHACWGGRNVTLHPGVYLSFNCTMIDDGNIEIGHNTIIGPNVTISTTNHPLEVAERLNGTLYISDVKIGNNVWIGAGTIILPGVTIGDNSVIGAGSIVTKDIPANVVAYGNPCRVEKKIDS